MSRQPDILYLSHGGGPLPLLGEPGHQKLVEYLQQLAAQLPRPKAILVISAHWEAPCATVGAACTPGLIYDYYGFAPEAYQLEYPCPGEPALAGRVHAALAAAGLPVAQDEQRGLDHGVFVPLMLMYPQADIPCLQLSLVDTLEADLHLRLGEALRALDEEALLVIGSGFSFHNMRAFFSDRSDTAHSANLAFDAWLHETCTSQNLDEPQRRARLQHWEQAPHARFCHPREEHLLPLQVCYGLAGRPCDEAHSLTVLGRKAAMFLWRG